MAKILYGIRKFDNKVISIAEIPAEIAQRHTPEWRCVCPLCNTPLTPKKGEKNEHHFAHEGDCDTEAATQTALHLMAKEIIAEARKIMVPPITVPWDEVDTNGIPPELLDEIPEYVYRNTQILRCSNVILEKQISNIVTDIIAETSRGQHLIEICVTHAVDECKKAKAEELNLPMIEIDLHDLYDLKHEVIPREVLKKILVSDCSRSKWICCPAKKDALPKALAYYRNHETVLDYLNEVQKAQQRKRNYQRACEYVSKLQQPETYAAALRSLRSDEAFYAQAHKFKFYSKTKEIPFFIDIPITGEMIFKCDRRIWQGKIFDRWIYNRKYTSSYIPIWSRNKSYKGVFHELKHKEHIPVDRQLRYKFQAGDVGSSLFFPQQSVILRYIDYLTKLGFISKFDKQGAYVAHSHTITPPNQEYAEALQYALTQVDRLAPSIDNLIDNALTPYYSYRKYIKQQEYEKQRADARARAEAERQAERQAEEDRLALGKEEVKYLDFSTKERIKDSYGNDWVECTECHEIFLEKDMTEYQFSQGICRSCSKQGRK